MSDIKICPNCGQDVPPNFKFCGFCGTTIVSAAPKPVKEAKEIPETGKSKAKLVLIKGEGLDGISYKLNSKEHITGRKSGAIQFPDDKSISVEHANFFYEGDHLWVKDLGSANGVYLRIIKPLELQDGDYVITGEQILRFEAPRPIISMVEAEGTYFYGSPHGQWLFKIAQLLEGGVEGIVYSSPKRQITIGREDCDLNFPFDRFISRYHTKISEEMGRFYLEDLDSRNGTYMRIKEKTMLKHGDYVFMGRQLLRVEMT